MLNFIAFEQVRNRKFHLKTCFGPFVKLVCYKDIRTICGTRKKYSYYLCLSNKLKITLQNEHRFSNVSMLLSYEIVQKLVVPFLLYDDQTYIFYTKTMVLPITQISINTTTYISHLYTIWAAHGNGIATKLSVLPIQNETNVFVKIYDGPVLVRFFSLYLLSTRELKYKAGFRMTIGIEFVDTIMHPSVSVSYKRYSFRRLIIDLDDYQGAKWMTSIDTTKREHKQVLYYKYLTVETSEPNFVQMTFTNLTTFSDASQGCEDGGFVLSDNFIEHTDVAGPFCTQQGTEPLVNAMRTFFSANRYITIFIYSYTFQMKVIITFQQTLCQGITNPCYRFCNRYKENGQKYASNYERNYDIATTGYHHSCEARIYINKGCVVVQKIPGKCFACKIFIQVAHLLEKTAVIRVTDFRVTDNIRYVSSHSPINLYS